MIVQIIDLEILKDLHILDTPDYEKVVFGMPPVFLNVYIDVHLAGA
jgi:hypothetical protein